MDTIVLGANHNNTLGLVWSLGEAGHTVTLLLRDSENNYVAKSRYVRRTIIVKQGDDVIGLIQRISSELREKPVVFVSGDEDANLLNNHCEELNEYCYFEGSAFGGKNINEYRNKDKGEMLARQCGFEIPETVVIQNPAEILSVKLRCPLLIKANNSVNGGKAAMKKCDTISEAMEFVTWLPKTFFPLQVQEFIVKEYEIMFFGCSLYGGKKLICPVAHKKIRQYPKDIGCCSCGQSVEVAAHDKLRSLVAKVGLYMQDIGYTGNFSAEFLYSQGKYYFLEINLRNDGSSWLSTCSGYNLPDMVARAFECDNVTSDYCVFHSVYYMKIDSDIHCLLNGTVGLLQWIRQLRQSTCYSHYNKKDKRPFFAHLKRYINPIRMLHHTFERVTNQQNL